MSKFGWSLPPGCTMADIDRAFGDDSTLLEVFESQERKNLTPEEIKTLTDLFELDCNNQLIEKALAWAHETGYKACECERAEAKYYESEYRQRVRLPKIRRYFKRLRARNPWGTFLKQIQDDAEKLEGDGK